MKNFEAKLKPGNNYKKIDFGQDQPFLPEKKPIKPENTKTSQETDQKRSKPEDPHKLPTNKDSALKN